LVADILMPPIGLLLGRVNFSNLFSPLGQPYGRWPRPRGRRRDHNYGLFLNTVIEFPIVALAVFLLIRLFNRLYQAPPATPRPKRVPIALR